MSFNFLGGFLLTPIVAGLSESYGRKCVLFLPTAADLMQRAVILPWMTMAGLIVSNVGGMFSVAGMNMGQTALADMFKDEPVEIARWTSLFQMASRTAVAA